jgi:hypothetical protein
VPSAKDALLGDAAWVQLLSFPEQAAASAVRAELGKREILRDVLLAPVSEAHSYFYRAFPQVEGNAVARFRFPTSSQSSHLRFGQTEVPLEIAWDNRVHGVVSLASLRAKVQVGARSLFGRSVSTDDDYHLSVAGPGVYVRLMPPDDSATTYYVEGSGKGAAVEELGAIRWPPVPRFQGSALLSTGREERIQVEGRHGGLFLYAGGRIATIAASVTATGSWDRVTPYLLGTLGADAGGYAQQVSLAYAGRDVGFVSALINVEGQGHRAYFVELGGTQGVRPPIRVPLQEDLSGDLVPCSEDQRKGTPRVEASAPPDVRRSVIVEISASETLNLVTEEAILFGTPEKPCVGVMQAKNPEKRAPQGPEYSALVSPGQVSWVFRVESTAPDVRAVSARPMSCQPSQESATKSRSSR